MKTYTQNFLESCANWLSTRAKTKWAIDCGNSSLMNEYAEGLRNIATASHCDLFRGRILAALEKVIKQGHIGGSLANYSLGDLATDLAYELEK